jgi:hypothetical protein
MGELQPRQTFFMPGVRPGQEAKNMRLSGGVKEPFYYSMSSRSTVPYVEISGGTKSNKLLSWGEVIMVPPGEMLTVKNASYHQGDVAINSGPDFVEIPTRVTVPVPFKITGTDPRLFYDVEFPVDCRRAKRAYGLVTLQLNVPVIITVEASQQESSFATGIVGDGTPAATPQYFEQLTIPPFTKFGLFPLGLRPSNDIIPMCLLDTAKFSYTLPPASLVPDPTNNVNLAFYVLEY